MKKTNVKQLGNIVGVENVRIERSDHDDDVRDVFISEAARHTVVSPETVEHVQDIMRYANEKKIPVTVKGSGSGIWGYLVSKDSHIVLDMKRMDNILTINLVDLYCRVEPGVIDDDLNHALKPYRMFYPPAPVSSRIATIGGEIANNANGVRSIKYGTVRDYILGMKIVLANGNLVYLGSKTRVEAPGYQLNRLVIGSEGTLGIIVEATLKFIPVPKFRGVAIAKFQTLEEASRAMCHVMSSGAQPSSIELMDYVAIKAVYKTFNLGFPDEEAILTFEADGMVKEAVYHEIRKMIEISEKNKGFGFELDYDLNEPMGIYSGSHELLSTLLGYKKNLTCTSLVGIVAAPYSKTAECTRKIHQIAERNNVEMSVQGHCSSGYMHTKIFIDPIEKNQREDAKRAVAEVYDYVRSVYGTDSAEQGIGLIEGISRKNGVTGSIDLMKAVKKMFDPNNILKPYKLRDAQENFKPIQLEQIEH